MEHLKTNPSLRAVDLCCGDGGVTRGMLAAGFDVLGVDVTHRPAYPAPILLKDVREVEPAELGTVDWLHASPPCTRFSLARANRKKDPPTEDDLDILGACLWLRDRVKPRWWSVENVRGAVPWFSPTLGAPKFRHGAFFIWGNFPPFLVEAAGLKKGIYGNRSPVARAAGKQLKPKNPWASACVPIEIARPMAAAIAEASA